MSAELSRPFSKGVLNVSFLRSLFLDWLDSRLFPSPVGGKGEEGWVSAPLVRLVPQTPFSAVVLCSQQSLVSSVQSPLSPLQEPNLPLAAGWVGAVARCSGGSLGNLTTSLSDFSINLILAFLLFHLHFQTYLVLPILNRLGILSYKPGWFLAYNSAFLGLLNH